MAEISIIIVSWNARGFLHDCLASIRATGSPVVRQTIVVDNASSDGSPDMVAKEFPEVTLIRSSENLGFARGNNLGLRHATGSQVALVNSDVVVHPGCFQQLSEFLERHPEVGLVGPKVFGRDQLVQPTCGRLPSFWNIACEFLLLNKLFPRWRFFEEHKMRPEDHERLAEVGVLGGCFWLAPRQAVDEVGGLDERFFFYAEDIDWCKRLADAGWKIMFVPEATITHFGGGSSSNVPLRYSIEMLRANLLYWKKHHGYFGQFMFYLLAALQHALRLIVRGFLKMIGVAGGDETTQKLKEHLVCLRWLLTGKGV